MKTTAGGHRKTVWIAALALIVAIVLVGVGWLAAALFVSPQQRNAAAQPPAKTPVFTPVTRGDLVDERALPAEIVATETQNIAVLSQGDATRTVITSTNSSPGVSVGAGSVILTANGAPVFLLASPFPFYRDLGVGDTGLDVQALQNNLVQLSLLTTADGRFGPRTASALLHLYKKAGFTAQRRADPAPETTRSPATENSEDPPKTPKHAYIPLSSMMGTTSLPALLKALPQVGQLVDDTTLVTLGSQTAEAKATIPDSLIDQVSAGHAAQLTLPSGEVVKATVDKIEQEKTDDGDQNQIIVFRRTDGKPMDPSLIGQPASATITLQTVAKDALIVPLIAVSKQPHGNGIVLVRQPDGSFDRVRVRILTILGGSAAVDGGDTLKEGDKVQVE